MSILSVDNISPIGSGTSVTINNAATLVLNNLSVSGVSTFSTANSTIGAIIKNTAHDSQLQILATYSNKNSVIFFGDAADDDIGQIDYDHNDNSLAFVVNTSEALRIGAGGGHKITCNESHFSANLSEMNTGRLALNIIKTRNGQTKGIGFGAIGSSTSDTGIQAYDTSNNSANQLLINPFGGFVGINETSPDSLLHLTTNDSTAYSTSTTNTVNSTNTLLRLENTNGSDGSGVNNYVGIYFRVGSGANSDSQLQYVRTGDNAGTFHFKARNAGSTYPNLMTIDSSGSVNKPKNPAFYAYLTANNAVYTAGTIIPWANTNIDTRSAFATSGSDIGRYTVPTTGIYYFGWRLNRRDDSRFDIAIYQNGGIKYIDEMRWAGTSGMWMAESGHYLLSCTAGQKVDLRVYGVTNAGSGQFDGGGSGYYDGFFGWMIG